MLGPVAVTPCHAESLDLHVLKTRLSETEAMGWLYKLKLSADVESLQGDIQARLQRSASSSMSDLRRRFDSLVDGLLSVLRESDPSLYAAVSESRTEIWTALTEAPRYAGSDT